MKGDLVTSEDPDIIENGELRVEFTGIRYANSDHEWMDGEPKLPSKVTLYPNRNELVISFDNDGKGNVGTLQSFEELANATGGLEMSDNEAKFLNSSTKPLDLTVTGKNSEILKGFTNSSAARKFLPRSLIQTSIDAAVAPENFR